VPFKPLKKTDKELLSLIETKIIQKKYIFLKHAQQRLLERNILELDVLNILSGKKGYGRKRNKKKDTYEQYFFSELTQDWKYCIEGCDIDGEPLRIIITFNDDLMPIITAITI